MTQAIEPPPSPVRIPRRIIVSGMHSPAGTWLLNAAIILLQLRGEPSVWAGWDHELEGGAFPPGTSVVRTHDFRPALAAEADMVLFTGRDLRDAVSALHQSFDLPADVSIADYIMEQATAWEAIASFSVSYEALLDNPSDALMRLRQRLHVETHDVAEIVQALSTIIDLTNESSANPTPPQQFRFTVSPDQLIAIERSHGHWIKQHGYPLLAETPNLSLCTEISFIENRLADATFIDAYIPASEPRQKSEMRGAVLFLHERAKAFVLPKQKLLFAERLLSISRARRAVLIFWAELLEEAGNLPEAAAKAREALSIFYDDIFVQRLFKRCVGENNEFENAGDRYCSRPFESFEILEDGRVYICNCTFLPFPVGNAFTDDAATIWNSAPAQAIRASILDGSFKYCSPMTCTRRFSLPKRSEHPAGYEALREIGANAAKPPTRLNLSYDRSCNLSCPSCRSEILMADQAGRKRFDDLRDRVVLPLLHTANFAYITGSGDPFGSPHFRSLLKRLCDPKFDKVELHLMTNGQLLTPRLWDEIQPLHSRLQTMTVSIDGATPATYEALRQGGSWPRIEEVMQLLSGARAQHRIRNLRVNMVVQLGNYREMIPLIDLCKSWNVDEIAFYRLRQWGTYASPDYMSRDVVNPLHPQHGDLLEVLADSRFADPMIYPFDLQPLIAKAQGPREI